jgi:hypothetical protein
MWEKEKTLSYELPIVSPTVKLWEEDHRVRSSGDERGTFQTNWSSPTICSVDSEHEISRDNIEKMIINNIGEEEEAIFMTLFIRLSH